MRVTNSMMISNMMKNVNTNMSKMYKYQSQLSSKSRITRLSDDPIGVTQSLQARSNLANAIQYRRNAEDAKSIMTFAETALMNIKDLLTRAYELTIDASNDSKSAQEREAIAVEIKEIKQEIINCLNTTYGDQYIFGGYNVTELPFDPQGDDILYNGVSIFNGDASELEDMKGNSIRYIVGKGIEFDVTKSGLEVIDTGDENIFNIFQELINDLESNQNVNQYIDKLNKASEHVLSVITEIGGKYNRLDTIISHYDEDEINYRALQSRIEDIDQGEVITQFKMQEAVYRMALAVGARVIQPALIDFLK